MDDRQSAVTVRPGLALLLGIASLGLLLWVGVKPTLAGINSDAAVYVLLADWLSPWRASDITFGARLFEHYPFPPLYPLLLAALGGGSTQAALDYSINALLQAGAVTATWCWARRAGCTTASAALAALTLVLTPIALFTAMGLFSEPLYLAVTMTALALVARRTPTVRAWQGAALLMGLAAVTRGVGLFAVLALLLAWAWRTRGRCARSTPLIALAPPLVWMMFKAACGWQGSYTHNLFGNGLWPVLLGLVEQVPTNLRALAYHFVRCFDSLHGQHSALIAALLLVPAGLTWLRRLRDGEVDAVYAALYLGVIVLWPYPNHFARFLLVLLPLFGAYAGEGVATMLRVGGQASLARFGPTLVALLLVLIVLPGLSQVLPGIARAADADERVQARISSWYGHDSLAEARRATAFSLRVLNVMAELGQHVPPGACVSSTMAEIFMLQSRRYSRPPPSERDPLVSLRRALHDCPYVLLLGATSFPAADFPAYYPARRLPGELQTLYRVALDPAEPGAAPLAILARYRAAPQGAAGH